MLYELVMLDKNFHHKRENCRFEMWDAEWGLIWAKDVGKTDVSDAQLDRFGNSLMLYITT